MAIVSTERNIPFPNNKLTSMGVGEACHFLVIFCYTVIMTYDDKSVHLKTKWLSAMSQVGEFYTSISKIVEIRCS